MDESLKLAQELGAVEVPSTPTQPASDGKHDELAAQLGAVEVPIAGTVKPTEEHATDLGGAVLRGLKNTLAPHLLTKEDLDGDRSAGELATEVGTGIAADIGTAAATGAVLGSVVPGLGTAAGATVSAVGWALYRGFGYEAARSKAQGEEFNPLRGVLNVGAEINPLLGKGSKILKAASQFALEGAREYSYTKDVAGSAVAGVLGGAFAGMLHHKTDGWLAILGDQAARPTAQTAKAGMLKGEVETLEQMVADKSVHGLGAKLEAGMAKAAQEPDFFNRQALDEEGLEQFQKWLINQPGMRGDDDNVQGAYKHIQKVHGEGFLDQAFKWYRTQQVGVEVVDQHNKTLAESIKPEDVLKGGPRTDDPLGTSWVNKFRDIKFVMRKIDKAVGLNFDGSIDRFSEAKNKQTVAMAPFLERANGLVSKGRKAGLHNNEVGKFLSYEKELTDFPDQHHEILNGWMDLWEDVRTKLNQDGLKIDFLHHEEVLDELGNVKRVRPGGRKGDVEDKRYLPSMSKRGSDAYTSVRREIERLEKKVGTDFLDAPESQDLRKWVAHTLGDDVDVENVYPSQLKKALERTLDPKFTKSAMGFDAAATHIRTGEVPAFIKDYDVGSAFLSYLNSTMKSLYYRDAFMQLETQTEMLRKMGFKDSAKYVENYMGHMSGKQSDVLAGLAMTANRYRAGLEATIDKTDISTLAGKLKVNGMEAARKMPDFIAFSIGQLYPSVLGFNMRAALRNYLQPFLTTAPELTWGYGSKLAGRAWLDMAKDKMRGVNLEEFLQSKQLAGGKFFGEGFSIHDDSLRSTAATGRSIELLEKYNSAAMWLYSNSDGINRYVTYKMGQYVADDLMKGGKHAEDFIKHTLSEGGRHEIRKLMREGKTDQIGDALGRYLIGKTQFNYGPQAMNEFGREYGRLFSMFTKWPAMIMSDSAELVENYGKMQGSIKIAQRYFAPMALLSIAGNALIDKDRDPTAVWLLGADLGDAAPAQSMKVGAPPVLKTAMDAGQLLLDTFSGEMTKDEKISKAKQFAMRTGTTFLPGMAVPNEIQRIRRAYTPWELQD